MSGGEREIRGWVHRVLCEDKSHGIMGQGKEFPLAVLMPLSLMCQKSPLASNFNLEGHFFSS